MKSDPENFDPLLQLLAFKRHEQPPPGYFENFSRTVIVRLKSGDVRKRGWWHDILDEAPWLQPILAAFEAKPLLAGAFGVVLCALVLSGITYSQRLDRATTTVGSALSSISGEHLFTAAPIPDTAKTFTSDTPAPAMILTSTNPVIDLQMPGTVFEMFRPKAQPANYNTLTRPN